MVRVTLLFDNVTATTNGIRVKYPDANISQSTHSALLKLIFLSVKACIVHLFDTLISGFIIYFVNLCNIGCTDYFNAKKVYILF